MVIANFSHAQKTKFDSTLKIGKTGYRVICSNKPNKKNNLRVALIGFEENKEDLNIDIKGQVTGAEIDDLNKDGFPDLVVYIVTDNEKNQGTVFAITSNENKTIAPIIFPSLMDNEKYRTGYTGNDVFKLLNGTLTHKFTVTDNTNAATQAIVARQLLYNVVKSDNGVWKFNVIRSIDIPRP
ncbi:MAG: hypothetical protein AMXMBFR79_06160 [Chitinophagaceae bacterium]